ncbi:unnamed protein product [Mytilus coruscus]|uniref:Uncharacterized protein n=1 Tax=Mytilus coruscus TaxID=42192 RepID=A0A6J8F2W6_MYTCO|nr:unnamed protein product [Mytilus coruscus]
MHIQIIILCIGYFITYACASVPMKVSSTWGKNGTSKSSAFCTFNVTEKQRKGAWKMTINTNIPTKYIKVWVMEVTDRLDGGKTYKMRNKYEYGQKIIDVHFTLTYKEADVPISGSCSSSVEETALLKDAGNIINENDWEENGMMVMQGKCILPVEKKLEDFYISVTLNEETFKLKDWSTTEFSRDPSGRWYTLKNKWTAHPPELTFIFHIYYDADKPPTGSCAILTGSEPKPPVTQEPPVSPTTRQTIQPTTTQKQATPDITKQSTHFPTTETHTTPITTVSQPSPLTTKSQTSPSTTKRQTITVNNKKTDITVNNEKSDITVNNGK